MRSNEAGPCNDMETILRNHGRRILHMAYSYLHNQNDAEDILQDTMVQLIKTKPHFENAEHEKAWLLRVCINLCKNRLKSPWSKYESVPEDYPADGIPVESVELFQAVSVLPIEYREVIHLFYYEDASTAEIASLLGKKESTVRSLLSRARTKLKDILKEVDWNETVCRGL